MAAAQFLKARISPETKRLVQAAAGEQLVTESMWLKRLVIEALRAAPITSKGALTKRRNDPLAERGS